MPIFDMAPGSLYSRDHSSPHGAIGTPVHASTSVLGQHVQPSDPTSSASLWARYEQLAKADQEKQDFLQELLVRYEYVSQEYDRLSSQRVCESGGPYSWQAEKQQYDIVVRNMQAALARNPFVVILIDGDGMIFQDHLLRDGEMGGRRAAAQLQTAIAQYIDQETKNIPTESRIICRIYAHVKGLADVLVKAGIIDHIGVFEDFVRGFTRGKTLFDFVDVGPGKDRADDKVIETFKLYIDDFHCRQIFFGCSHDNGFARTLEEYMTDDAYVSKVTLLEGAPFEKELRALPYITKKFPDIFRDTKIKLYNSPDAHVASPAFRGYNMVSGLPTRFPPSRPTSGYGGSSLLDSPFLAKVATTALPRTPSSSTLASDGMPFIKPPMSWAAKATAPPPPVSDLPEYQPANRDEVIARNRAGQRVDPQTRDYDKAEVDRIKKIKMCNVHFLRQECPYGNQCTHVHDYKPTNSELATLRLVARMAPCQNGSACQDIKCIYGHGCPAPASKTNKVKGTRTCIFGDTCKFPPELHDIDCNVVKTLVVR